MKGHQCLIGVIIHLLLLLSRQLATLRCIGLTAVIPQVQLLQIMHCLGD